MRMQVDVYLWGSRIGRVLQDSMNSLPRFAYDPEFVKSGIELSPIVMPLAEIVYSFPNLNEKTFYGLPGLVADSLPDKFGTRIMTNYLAKLGKQPEDLTAVERLCYVGSRGMGALEFVPQTDLGIQDECIDIDDLAKLADKILSERKDMHIKADERAMEQLLKVGTSAGGARAKALIAWNEDTKDIRSGQIDAGDGYGYWLLKFGNVENNKDKDKESDHMEYPKIEYAYSLMTKDAGIDMTECRLIKSREGIHFMTRRFDRDKLTGKRIHMQSLGGIAHFDFNNPGAHSYEQAAAIIQSLNLSQADVEQLYRRMVFNEVSKNYDDHVKNISFLMNRQGEWNLAPAYDMTFSYNPNSIWTSSHQMTINGKREKLTLEDLKQCGKSMNLSERKINAILQQVISVVGEWEKYAEYAGISEEHMNYIQKFHNNFGYQTDASANTDYLDAVREKNPQAFVKV